MIPPATASGDGLRARMRRRERMRGVFVKIPHPQVVELLSAAGVDFLVLDAEHAAFDIRSLDACILAARAWSVPVLVRVPSIDSPLVAVVLDMGAQGVFLPHVANMATAERGLRAALYNGGVRGLTGSARSGNYGGVPDLAVYSRNADAEVVIVAQLEDAEALDHIEALVGIDRIDGFFIGAADLGQSLANSGDGACRLADAVARLAAAVLDAGRPLGTYVDRMEQAADFPGRDCHFLAIGSDQTMLRRAATAIAAG